MAMVRETNDGAGASIGEIFLVFLSLGLTSFGGPIAHLGYFREAFVERRRWFDDRTYADIVALCQFLPGPASSQVGMCIGLLRAGPAGMFAAWLGFTLPSAVLMAAFALTLDGIGHALGGGWLVGLKAVAVAVVAQALLAMRANLAPDVPRVAVAVAAAALAFFLGGTAGQLAGLGVGLLAGLVLPAARRAPAAGHAPAVRLPRLVSLGALALFAVLLVALPALAAASGDTYTRLADGLYRAGALVFGGGHVVLPLLRADVVDAGLVAPTDFLAGYGAAQAMPGPLFTFSAFLGARAFDTLPAALGGAALATVAIFLSSALLVLGALPFWASLAANATARRLLDGANAAVVGLLAAAFVDPVLAEGATTVAGAIIAVAAFAALVVARLPVLAVVAGAALAGLAAPLLSLA